MRRQAEQERKLKAQMEKQEEKAKEKAEAAIAAAQRLKMSNGAKMLGLLNSPLADLQVKAMQLAPNTDTANDILKNTVAALIDKASSEVEAVKAYMAGDGVGLDITFPQARQRASEMTATSKLVESAFLL